MFAAFLANPFLAPLSLCSRRWFKRWRTQNVLIKCGINTPQNNWNQNAFLVIYFPWINREIMVLKTLKAKETFTSEYSTRWKRRTTVCRLCPPSEILRNKIYETLGRIVNELSKKHETEVHVLSDSVLCLGNNSMTSQGTTSTERWKGHLEHNKDIAKIIDGATIQFTLYTSPVAKTSETILNIDEWIRPCQGKDEQQFNPATCPRRDFSREWRMPISAQKPKGCNAQFQKRYGKICSLLRKVEVRVLDLYGQDPAKTRKFDKYINTRRKSGTNVQIKSRMYILHKTIQSWKHAKAYKKKNSSEMLKTCTSTHEAYLKKWSSSVHLMTFACFTE